MNAEDASVYYRAQGEIVEDLATPSPDVAAAVLPLALVVESVNLGNLPRLVVPSNQRYSFGISDLQRKQQEKCLNTVKTPINKVT
jgi:hypothetical protein